MQFKTFSMPKWPVCDESCNLACGHCSKIAPQCSSVEQFVKKTNSCPTFYFLGLLAADRQGKSNQFNGLDIFMAANDTAVGRSQKNAGYMTLYTVKRSNGSFAVNSFRFIHVCFVLVVVCNVRQFTLG